MLDASPLKNSYIGKIIHDRYQNHLQQPDGGLTLSSILNETLIMLKGRPPNKPLLEPLAGVTKTDLSSRKLNPQIVVQAVKDPSTDKQGQSGRYNNLNRLNDSFERGESYDSLNFEQSPKHNRGVDTSYRDTSFDALEAHHTSMVLKPEQQEQINLDLNELTQEDKFYLIQQIEDLNKNIRYC